VGWMKLRTRRGYELSVAASAVQKAIRRGETALAGHFALDMFESGFQAYLWRRLLTVSAEDCYGVITHEIEALHRAWELIEGARPGKVRGRIFVSKAVILLSLARKSRDADHLQNLVVDPGLVDEQAAALVREAEADPTARVEIPEWVYDCHTRQGRALGKTKAQFFRDEHQALRPRQKGLFDDLAESATDEPKK
jgi:replication-associated recombination protein RarA